MINLLIKAKQGIVKALELVVIMLFLTLVLNVLWGVISRSSGQLTAWMINRGYQPWGALPRGQTPWTEEVAINLLVWISLLGASLAYGAKAHLGVDYFVTKLDNQAQKLAEVVVNIIVAVFSVVVLIVGGYILVTRTLAAGQVTPALEIKVGYIYLATPISGLFILLFCMENILEIITGRSAELETTLTAKAARAEKVPADRSNRASINPRS